MALNDILSAFLSLTHDAVVVAQLCADGQDAHFQYVNPAFTDLFGWDAEDILNQPVSGIHEAGQWPEVLERISALLRGAETGFSLNARARRAEDARFWVSMSVSLSPADSDGARFLILVYREIDEVIQQCKAAEAEQNRLLAAINAFPDPFAIYAPDGELVACNASYAQANARNPDRIKPGLSFKEVVDIALDDGLEPEPPEGREAYVSRMQYNTRTAPSTIDIELSGDRHERVRRNVSATGDIIILRADITEAVRQRRAAEAAGRRLLGALNAVPDPFVIYDEDGTLVACNYAFAKTVAKDPARIRPGMTFRQVTSIAFDDGLEPEPPEGREAFFSRMEAGARTGADTRHLELPDDRHHRITRSVSASGDLIELYTDITEPVRQRRAAEAAQYKAEEAQGRLLSAINTFPDPFVIYDKDGYLVTCNKAYREDMALSPERIHPGMHFREIIGQALDDGRLAEPPQGRDALIDDLWYSAIRGERIRDVQSGPDQHYRALRSVAENGDIITIRLDISELIQQRRAAEAAEARLLGAIDAYPDPFVIYDRDRKLVACNTAYEATMSKDPDFLKPGMPFDEVYQRAIDDGLVDMPAEGTEEFARKFEELADESEEGADLQLPGDVHYRVIRRVTGTGDAVSLRINVTDFVRQRRAAEEAQSRMMATLNAYPYPFVIYDKDSRLVACNSSYSKMMSKDPDRLRMGMHYRDIYLAALEDGLVLHPKEDIETYIERFTSVSGAITGAFDIELPGDIHQRVIRSRTESGDFMSTRVDITELVHQRRAAEEAQSRLMATLNAYPYPFVIFDKDTRLVACNSSYEKSMCVSPNSLRPGVPFREMLEAAIENGRLPPPPEGIDAHVERMSVDIDETSRTFDLELPGGQHHRIIRSRSEGGDFLSLRIDVTELVHQRHAAEQARRDSEKARDRLLSAINAYPGPISIFDADKRLIFYNEHYAKCFSDATSDLHAGMTVKEILTIGVQNGRFPGAIGREDEWLKDRMRSVENPEPVEDLEIAGDRHHRIFRSRSKSNDLIVVRLDMTEQVRQQRAVQQYAARLEEANSEIMFKACHDELTGLGNRRYIIEKIDEFRERHEKDGGVLAVIHVDLDRFKQINDTMGHAAGDHVLRVVARRIRGLVQPGDAVARIGGDEFVILIWQPDSSERALTLAKSIVEAMLLPTAYDCRECRFGASAGVAQTPLVAVDELLTSSDIALYKAKRSGRGRVAMFDAVDVEEMHRSKKLADDVIRGLEAGEFIPYYQPQVDARSGKLVGLEALARWQHPELGILPPVKFLSAAADLSLVSEIDRMVFERAITQCSEIFGSGGSFPKLSFNVSAKRVSDGKLEDITRRISQYPGEVSFELLETIFMEEEDDTFLFQLDRLREGGVSIEVDDFGSGRASIMALQRIAPDRLKIDGRLVRPICESEQAARLVKSILEIGHALSIEVIAEGVETAKHAQILMDLGVNCLQGYYFSRPLSVHDLRAYVKTLGNSGNMFGPGASR